MEGWRVVKVVERGLKLQFLQRFINSFGKLIEFHFWPSRRSCKKKLLSKLTHLIGEERDKNATELSLLVIDQ